MATLPYLLMSNTTTNQKQQEPTKPHIPSLKQEPSLTTRGGRKPNKGQQARKKIPQRGMGVAKLEILRVQESLKDIQETNKLDHSFNIQPTHLTVPDPIQSFPPVHYSVNYSVPPVINSGGFLSYDQGLVLKKIENGNGNSSTLHSGQFVVNPYVFGAPGGSLFENSKELSSMPKINYVQHFEHSSSTTDLGFKKKRFNGENNGRKDQKYCPEITPVNVSEFLGSNLENDLNYHPSGFGARAARSAFYATHQNEGAEVLAIRRNQSGGNVFMEYDFFPSGSGGNKSINTCFKEMEFEVGSGEASCLTSSDNNHSGYNYSASNASSSSSNSIDLSLKLSC